MTRPRLRSPWWGLWDVVNRPTETKNYTKSLIKSSLICINTFKTNINIMIIIYRPKVIRYIPENVDCVCMYMVLRAGSCWLVSLFCFVLFVLLTRPNIRIQKLMLCFAYNWLIDWFTSIHWELVYTSLDHKIRLNWLIQSKSQL